MDIEFKRNLLEAISRSLKEGEVLFIDGGRDLHVDDDTAVVDGELLLSLDDGRHRIAVSLEEM